MAVDLMLAAPRAARGDSDAGAFGRSPSQATEMPAEQRIPAALSSCVARWGLGKTTLDDIAREAGCSRATVYRCFPGGKSAIVRAAGAREVVKMAIVVIDAIDPSDLPSVRLSEAIVTAARYIADHQAFTFLLNHEPELLRPFLAFDRLDPLLAMAVAFVGPCFDDLGPDDAAEVVEWAARLLVSFLMHPSPTVDLTSMADVSRLVGTYLQALLAASP